jgi:hypothetical protein
VLYPNLFYVLYFKILCNCFLNFVIHKMNFEIVKFETMLLTRRENINVVVE